MQMTDNKFPAFIPNEPLGEDLLEGQSQKNIAASLADCITNNRILTRLIGLDGPWGSGKSNLIKMLGKELKESHHLFIYDAWGHQGDPQRRSFLEELTENLCEKKLIDEDTWRGKLKDLLARKREVISEQIPRLSLGIIISIFMVILTPIFKSIVEALGINGWLGAIITAIPLISVFFAWIVACVVKWRIFGSRELFYLFSEHTLNKTINESISEREPSVTEFRSWINDLVNDLKKTNLIVVFDNMDRLPPDRVRDLWASIHTFFAEQSHEKVWVIVPFDRNHLGEVFKEEGAKDEFLQKSFSVIYRVSPPILTDWQHFFDKKFESAFSSIEAGDQQIVRQTFNALSQEITPRKIISFINEIVAIRLSTEADIKLRYIALFALTKEKIMKSPVDEILDLNFLGGANSLFESDSNNVQGQITALTYQVLLGSARQVTLTSEISNALNGVDKARLKELASRQHFTDILEEVVIDPSIEISNSVVTLDSLGDEEFDKGDLKDRYQAVWDNLCSAQMKTPAKEQAFTKTYEILLKRSSVPKKELLVKHIISGVRNAKNFSGDGYYKTLKALHDYVKGGSLRFSVPEMTTEIQKSAKIFVDYLGAAGKNYKDFKLICKNEELIEYIKECTPEEMQPLVAIAAIKEDEDFNLTDAVTFIEGQISASTVTAKNIADVYTAYRAMTEKMHLQLLGDSQINALLQQTQAGSKEQLELLAMRIARADEYAYNSDIAQTILAETDAKVITEIAKRIENYAYYNDLLLKLPAWPEPVLKAILKEITLTPGMGLSLNVADVLAKYEKIRSLIDVEPKEFLTKLNSWSTYASKDINDDNFLEVVTTEELIEHAVTLEYELTDHLIALATNHIRGASVEDWNAALRNGASFLFRITHALLSENKLEAPPANCVNAYIDLVKDFSKGGHSFDPALGLDLFYEKIDPARLIPTAKDIRDQYILEGDITPNQFLVLHKLLISCGSLEEKSAEVARRILTPAIRDDGCLTIIIAENNADIFSNIIKDAGDDASDLKEFLREKLKDEEERVELEKFCELIGINVKKNQPRSESAEQP